MFDWSERAAALLFFSSAKWGGSGAIAARLSRMASDSLTGQLRHGDPIVELYDELRPSLFGYLICLGLAPPQAEDKIQDTFLQLFRFLQSGGAVKNPRSWLFRVAHNLSFNLQKRERRLMSASDPLPAAELAAAEAGPNPEEIYVKKERLLLLDAAITELPQRQRECLYLRAEGLRYREIAEVVGTTTSAVSEALKRAVVRLRGEIHEGIFEKVVDRVAKARNR